MSDDTTNIVGGINLNDLVPAGGTPTFENVILTGITQDNTQTNLLTLNSLNELNTRTVASLPGANPFNQSLNTTDSPTFANITDVGTITATLCDADTYYVGTPTATTLTGALIFPSVIQNRLINLYQEADDDNNCYAFGIQASQLAYTVPGYNANHLFLAGNATDGSSTGTNPLFRINGNASGAILFSNSATAPTVQFWLADTYSLSNSYFYMDVTGGQMFSNSNVDDSGIINEATQQLLLGVGPGDGSTVSQIAINSGNVILNKTLVLNDIANDNTQGNFVMWNSGTGATIYRTLASIGVPTQNVNTNSSPTFQNLTLTGSADTYLALETDGTLGVASTSGIGFSNSIPGDIYLAQQGSGNFILLGIGMGASQLSIGNTVTTNNTYIYGGLTCTIAAQTAAGTGATASITSSSQTGGIFSITAGSLGTPTTGVLAIITLPVPTPVATYGIVLTAQNATTALVAPLTYATSTNTTHWQIGIITVALTGVTTYTWNWSICL
jgi:hypothetical protein